MKVILLIIVTSFFSNGMFSQTYNPRYVQELNLKNNADTVEAEYPGGEESLILFLSRNIQYPKEAQKKGIEGKSQISFIICEDGSLCDFKVNKSSNTLLDNEAIRVLKKMPKWTPAKVGENNVKSFFILPVSFSLE